MGDRECRTGIAGVDHLERPPAHLERRLLVGHVLEAEALHVVLDDDHCPLHVPDVGVALLFDEHRVAVERNEADTGEHDPQDQDKSDRLRNCLLIYHKNPFESYWIMFHPAPVVLPMTPLVAPMPAMATLLLMAPPCTSIAWLARFSPSIHTSTK